MIVAAWKRIFICYEILIHTLWVQAPLIYAHILTFFAFFFLSPTCLFWWLCWRSLQQPGDMPHWVCTFFHRIFILFLPDIFARGCFAVVMGWNSCITLFFCLLLTVAPALSPTAYNDERIETQGLVLRPFPCRACYPSSSINNSMLQRWQMTM